MTPLIPPKHTEMIPVDSSDIVAIGYFNSNLTVAFRRGPIIRYRNVPYEKFYGLIASSTEDYIGKHISGKYDSKTVGEVV